MATYTPDQYVVVLRKRTAAWSQASQVKDDLRRGLEADVRKNLTGPLTRAQERRMGYPYGREPVLGKRRGRQRQIMIRKRGRVQPMYRGRMPILPINYQQGTLLRAARIFSRKTEEGYEVGLHFLPVKAAWTLVPGGTQKEVARGFWREINRQMLYRKAGIIKRTKMLLVRH